MLTREQILARVNRVEDDQGEYRRLAATWERMWRLEAFRETHEEALKDGRELVTLPDPYNVVNLGLRLLSGEPAIDVPSEDVSEGKDEAAEKRKTFLKALWHRSNREQRRNIVKDAAWQGFVRGRFVFEVKWIREQLPKRLQKSRLPILIRTLDPMNVGVKMGPLGPLYAYHRYEDERALVLQRWPEVEDQLEGEDEEDTLTVTDFWWVDQGDGSIWNAILVEEDFVKEPTKTDYPDIPIVMGYADAAPVMDEGYKGLGLLHPLNGVWQYQCRLASQMATGLLWYFWPAILVFNEMGQMVNDIDITPGTTNQLPPGTRVDVLQTNPNVPLAQALQGHMDTVAQQSTFPGVMYGQAPGDLQAGYGINLLSDAARGRVNGLRENLEWAIATVNEIALGLVEKMAGRKGVAVWGYDEGADGVIHVEISKKDISGYYENYVRLTPSLPSDDLQRQTLGLRLVDGQIISRRTYRQKYLNVALPSDEEERVLVEEAIMDPAIRKRALDEAMRQYFGPRYEEIVGQQGLPPEQGAPPGVAPPGAMDSPSGPVSVPPPDMPPEGPADLQAPGLLPGLPPEAQGQLTPEMMGNIPPELFQALMEGGGRPGPPTDEEILGGAVPPAMP